MYALWTFLGNAHLKISCKQLCPQQSVQFKQLKEVMGQIIWQSSLVAGFRPQQLKISCGVTNSSRVGAIIVSARGGWWGLWFKINTPIWVSSTKPHQTVSAVPAPYEAELAASRSWWGPALLGGDASMLLPCRETVRLCQRCHLLNPLNPLAPHLAAFPNDFWEVHSHLLYWL